MSEADADEQHTDEQHTDKVADTLARLAESGPYFAVGTGPVPGDGWQPTAALRDRAVRDDVVEEMAHQLGVDEVRVAASTLFFGYAARLWSTAIGTHNSHGRSVSLDPAELLWRSVNGSLHLHIAQPRLGRSIGIEVLDHQLDACVGSWREIVAPGLLWGNTASALRSAALITGTTATPVVAGLLDDPRLRGAFDPDSARRRSCCLFYRTPTGGVCGDCPFPSPPSAASTTEETP